MKPEPGLTRLVPVLLGVGAVLLWNALRRFRKIRRIQDTARSKAASAPQGHVELQGVAWPEGDGAMVSPSGTEVVYHALKIQREEWRGTGKNRRKEWVTVFRKEHAPQFFLADATGLVRVDPIGAELDFASDRIRSWSSLSQAEGQRVLEATAGSPISGFPPSRSLFGLFSSRFRLVESEIRVGSPLYAHGEFRTEAGTLERARCRGLTAFHARFFDPSRREQKRFGDVLDSDGDGRVSAADAIEGLCRAAASDREAAKDAGTAESEFPVHGRLATSPQHKLFVADRHEEHLVGDVGRTVHLPLAGGAAALAAALLLMMTGDFPLSRGSARPPVVQAGPQPGVHDALRARCLGGQSAACEELLRRSSELRVSDAYRRDYARQACELGLRPHCADGVAP